MKPKAKWKERIDRHRAQGQGRKVFWVLVLGAVLIAGVGLVKGFGHDRARPQDGRHFATAASPEQLADRIDHLLDHGYAPTVVVSNLQDMDLNDADCVLQFATWGELRYA